MHFLINIFLSKYKHKYYYKLIFFSLFIFLFTVNESLFGPGGYFDHHPPIFPYSSVAFSQVYVHYTNIIALEIMLFLYYFNFFF